MPVVFLQRIAQNVANFLLNRMVMLLGTALQPAFHGIIQVADENLVCLVFFHASMIATGGLLCKLVCCGRSEMCWTAAQKDTRLKDCRERQTGGSDEYQGRARSDR